jgi:16S rRNA (adenine1518-N6/adenine1519-N6)-dimethyltransferase
MQCYHRFIENCGHVLYIDPVSARMLPPKKSLGQNFLRDDNVARNIVESLHLRSDDTTVEIGPGGGALTKLLQGRCSRVIAIEVDQRAVKVLQETFGDSIELVHADVRSVSLGEFTRRRKGRLRVVGNIPYNITSEILFWLFDQYDVIEDATLMLQLEVARRFVARTATKEYGILSVFLQYYTEPELLFKVSRNSFYPKPTVDSAVVRLRFKHQLPSCNMELFRAIVRGTFWNRRKTLRNGLRYLGFTDDQLNCSAIDLSRRPESLTLREFLDLTADLDRFSESITNRL